MKLDELFESLDINQPLYHTDSGNPNKKIIWLSTSKKHSQLYGQNTESYEFNGRPKIIDLGFRSADTSVKFSEVRSRLMRIISHRTLMKYKDDVLEYDVNEMKRVWEWMYDPLILQMIKDDGYTVIRQREGIQAHVGDVTTYGVLDKRIIKVIR